MAVRLYIYIYGWSRGKNPLHYLLHVLWGHEVKGLIKGKDNDITCMVTWHTILVEEHMHGYSMVWKNDFPVFRQLQNGFCYLPFIDRLLEFVFLVQFSLKS